MKASKSTLGFSGFPALLIVLVMFGIVNMVLYFSQEFGRDADKKELEELKAKLDKLKYEADTIETKIRSADDKVTAAKSLVSRCKARIAAFDSQAVNGSLPPKVYSEYTLTIDRCNNQVNESNNLVISYNSLYAQYEQIIQAHNSLVPRTNELSQSLGTRYYIVPVPSLRRGR